MNAPALRALAEESTSERRSIILDAAERSFTRAGFHRTTMQDVAAEAGMSPGNLYRYFPSKDALVAGLCERDRAGLANEFAEVREAAAISSPPSASSAAGISRTARATSKAKLCLEIWAEAARNPAIAALQTGVRPQLRRAARRGLRGRQAGRRDRTRTSISRAVASIICKLGDGLFVRRAVAADFDRRARDRRGLRRHRRAAEGRRQISLVPSPTPESTS